MVVIRGLKGLNRRFPFPVVTIGNFDGVHLGHQKIFKRVIEKAGPEGTPMVITFDPHPVKIVSPERDIRLLTPLEDKIKLIEVVGIKVIICIDFDREFSRMTAEEFIEGLLIKRIGVRGVIVGHDYRFGRGKKGDVRMLRRYSRRFGFDVNVVRNMKIMGQPVSSTRIRQLLQWGRICEASSLLGRAYSIHGRVIRGAGRGSELLGTPTANISTPHELIPREGVYAVKIRVDGGMFDGVANIGRNPTFGGGEMSYEVHVFDFRGDILGREMRVYFIGRIRGEETFPDALSLRSQIGRDILSAKEILKEHRVNIYP